MKTASLWGVALVSSLCLALGCKNNTKISLERASQHVVTLVETAKTDVEEVRRGLPEGAKTFIPLFRPRKLPNAGASEAVPTASASAAASAAPPASAALAAPGGSLRPIANPLPAASGSSAASMRQGSAPVASNEPVKAGQAPAETAREVLPDAPTAREALFRARDKVQDLRVAKSTFFALADANGIVLRNDQEQDSMVTRPLFPFFPELRKALGGKRVETRGSMPEAAGVKGRPDGQWVAAQPIMVEGRVRALYLTGWSWSSYAYRLETSLRGIVRSELPANANEPLLYVFVIVNKDVFGAPVSPDIDIKAIADQDPLSKLQGEAVWAVPLTITNRVYGLAVKRAPVLGPDVAIAVLRSEV